MIDATLTLIDSGLFTELAVRLTREFSKIRSSVAWEAEFPTLNDRAIGSGLEDIEWVEDPYLDRIVESTDLFMFPDIFNAGKQQLLKSNGKLVWGSNTGDELETKRIGFRILQEKLGMPVPKYELVTGWSELAAWLKEFNDHCFIKTTSKIRGTMETHEFFDFEQDEYWLWNLRCKMGGGAEKVQFLIEMPVESPFETGIDTYCVNGEYPETPMQGIEIKGKLMLSSAQTRSNTPKALDQALTTLAPELKKRHYCNFLSAEFRGDILTDFCARAPNPGIGVEMEMIKNLGEIIVGGVQGKLVQPVYEAEFGIQAAVFHDHDDDLWKQFRIDPSVRRWFKLMEFCEVESRYQIVPRPPFGSKIGWIVGIGNSIREAAAHLEENCEYFKKYPFDIRKDCLEEAIKQAHDMKEEGFEFTHQRLPAPDSVLEEK